MAPQLSAAAAAENTKLFAGLKGRVAPETVDSYVSRMRTLSRDLGVSVGSVMRDPTRYMAVLHARSGSQGSERNLVKTLLSLFKYNKDNPDLEWVRGKAAVAALAVWKTHHAALAAKEELRAMQNKPTNERQIANYVELQEVKEKLDELMQNPARHKTRKDSMVVLLLSILEHLPPGRADLGRVHVFLGRLPTALKPPYLAAEAHKDREARKRGVPVPSERGVNFVLLLKSGDSVLVMRNFKTVEREGEVVKKLPEALVAEIRESLAAHPRQYLLVNARSKPFSNKSFSSFFIETFKELFGRGAGASLMRHVYIRERLDFDKMNDADLKEIAHQMGHSEAQQRKYKWKNQLVVAQG